MGRSHICPPQLFLLLDDRTGKHTLILSARNVEFAHVLEVFRRASAFALIFEFCSQILKLFVGEIVKVFVDSAQVRVNHVVFLNRLLKLIGPG